jgi:hypothetical protein
MSELFRAMRRDVDGKPLCGASRRHLGVLVPGDIASNANGLVQPLSGGLSVSPDTIANLPQHRRPPAHGGTGKDPVFVIDSRLVPEPLSYRPDPGHSEHGFIEPAAVMPLEQYQSRLCKTRTLWSRV